MNFKRFLLMTLCLVLTMLCLASCSRMDNFEKRLEEKGYKVEILDAEKLEELADPDDGEYKIKKMLLAADKHGNRVYIYQCGDLFAATDLADDLKEDLNGKFEVEIKQSFNFVIIETEDAFADALGK